MSFPVEVTEHYQHLTKNGHHIIIIHGPKQSISNAQGAMTTHLGSALVEPKLVENGKDTAHLVFGVNAKLMCKKGDQDSDPTMLQLLAAGLESAKMGVTQVIGGTIHAHRRVSGESVAAARRTWLAATLQA